MFRHGDLHVAPTELIVPDDCCFYKHGAPPELRRVLRVSAMAATTNPV